VVVVEKIMCERTRGVVARMHRHPGWKSVPNAREGRRTKRFARVARACDPREGGPQARAHINATERTGRTRARDRSERPPYFIRSIFRVALKRAASLSEWLTAVIRT
jgi:hypothetical protein